MLHAGRESCRRCTQKWRTRFTSSRTARCQRRRTSAPTRIHQDSRRMVYIYQPGYAAPVPQINIVIQTIRCIQSFVLAGPSAAFKKPKTPTENREMRSPATDPDLTLAFGNSETTVLQISSTSPTSGKKATYFEGTSCLAIAPGFVTLRRLPLATPHYSDFFGCKESLPGSSGSVR